MIDDSDTTSNEQDRRPDPAATGGRTSFIRDWILLGTVVGVFALDQATKRLIDAALDLGESWPSEGFIRITYGTNSGTAFGLFPNQTPAADRSVHRGHWVSRVLLPCARDAERSTANRHRPATRRSIRQSHRPRSGGYRNRLHRRRPMANLQHRRLVDRGGDRHLDIHVVVYERVYAEEADRTRSLRTPTREKRILRYRVRRGMSEAAKFVVAEGGERLDVFLTARRSDLSRSRIRRLVEDGSVTVDGRCSKASFRLSTGQTVRLEIPPPSQPRLRPRPHSLEYRIRGWASDGHRQGGGNGRASWAGKRGRHSRQRSACSCSRTRRHRVERGVRASSTASTRTRLGSSSRQRPTSRTQAFRSSSGAGA